MKIFSGVSLASVLLSVILLAGCASGSLYDKPTPSTRSIPMNAFTLSIEDRRETTTRQSPITPFISFPWQKDRVSPRAGSELRRRIERALRRVQQPGTRTLDFQAEFIEGWKGFSAEIMSETETVSWQIDLTARENGKTIGSSSGRCDAKRTSLSASEDELHRMYIACFEQAVRDALNKLELPAQ